MFVRREDILDGCVESSARFSYLTAGFWRGGQWWKRGDRGVAWSMRVS